MADEQLPAPAGEDIRTISVPLHFIQKLIEINLAFPVANKPSALARVQAAIEFILIKMIKLTPKHALVNDNGWPVPRNFTGTLLIFEHFGFQIVVNLFKDLHSVYILFHFDKLSYRLVECQMKFIPEFANAAMDSKRFTVIHEHFHVHVFRQITINKKPKLQAFEKKFLKFEVPPQANVLNAAAVKNLTYDGLIGVGPLLTPLERLYRITVQLMTSHGCTGENNGQGIPVMNQYEDDLIKVVYDGITYHFSILRAINEFYYIVRNHEKDYENGYRIPLAMIPSLEENNIARDNLLLVNLDNFIFDILLFSSRFKKGSRKPRSNALSISSHDFDQMAQEFAMEEEDDDDDDDDDDDMDSI